jgi:fatty acid desaturase
MSATVSSIPINDRVASDAGFPGLQRRVSDAGLLTRQPKYYVSKIAVTIGCYAIGWVGVVVLRDSWLQLGAALYLAFWQVQIGLLMHDVGHLQAFTRRWLNRAVCLLCGNLLIGVSSGWWVRFHNRHHSYPNHRRNDPTVARRMAMFAELDAPQQPGLLRRAYLRGYPVLFFLLYAFLAPASQVGSLFLALARRVRDAALEFTLIATHLSLYLVAVVGAMPAEKIICFVVVEYGIAGLYMGVILAPNHIGMPVWDDADALPWLPRQVLTTRNIRPGRMTDFVFGGLNYQIEHHLFPTMSRPCLGRARGLVVAHCRSIGLPYHETTLPLAFVEIFRYLVHSTRRPRRRAQ